MCVLYNQLKVWVELKKKVLAQQEEILQTTAFIFKLHPSLSCNPSLPPILSVLNFPIFTIV